MLEPVVAVHRVSISSSMRRAEAFLEAGRPWSAWRLLQPHLTSSEATAATMLLAARAAAGWGGWPEVRGLLDRREWLDRVDAGAGWLLLAEAAVHTESWSDAAEAYRRYLALGHASRRGLVQGQYARALLQAGRPAEAVGAFAEAAIALPVIADWLRALEMEARLAAGMTEIAGFGGTAPAGSAAARLRRARAETALLMSAGNPSRVGERLDTEIRILTQQGALVEAAELSFDLVRHYLTSGRDDEARQSLRSLAWESALPAALRLRAANLLGEQPLPLTVSEELARAAAYEANRRAAPAARSLRGALAAGAVDDPSVRLRLGKLLFQAEDHRAARAALLLALDDLTDPEQRAEVELLAARARFRGGDKAGGLAELRALAARRPTTAATGSALFMLADAAATADEAIPLYRRAAAVAEAPEAKDALFRLGDRLFRGKDTGAAIRAWEEYVGRYPTGEETARLAFRVALIHQQAGRSARAATMYSATILADPLSYNAVRAGERLGQDPLASVLAYPRPWIGMAVDPIEAHAALERLDLLHALGLTAEWKLELESVLRRLDRRPAALIAMAEGLRDRGHTVEAIRLARQLLEKRGGQWDERLLRVAFPLPFRELLHAEAERYGIDAMLFAALVRQESAFRPAVRSRAGATGLSQIMPATGRWLAPRVGVPAPLYEDRLLNIPEVNLGMGALYLADLLKRYGGAVDLALAGYNAGPSRADRWRRELGYDRDVDAFRAAIPFDETRHYVQIVLRNAVVYDRLYRSRRGFAELSTLPAEPPARD